MACFEKKNRSFIKAPRLISQAFLSKMTFSMVPITEAYSMTSEPPSSNLRQTATPLHPNQADPGQATAPSTTPPLPLSFAGRITRNQIPPSPPPMSSRRARVRTRTSGQPARVTPHATAVAEQEWTYPADPPATVAGGYRGGVRPHQPCHYDNTPQWGCTPLSQTGTCCPGNSTRL